MPEHAPYRDDDIVNPETRHEDSDVNVRALLWAVVIFIVFAFVTHAVLYLQFHAYARHFRNESSQPLTMMKRPSNVPPLPRLQPFPNNKVPPNTNTPLTDMADMRAAEDEALNKPGWVDKQKGVVRLPIETAKQLVVQRGLPVVTP
ncbi:MAG TPA: hypothetical protein VGQ65_07535 [Thermoanaerobaculia bacterium]|jgi:hypothetical protein|nr:hypothetical protein [Thermoanaerobaculia bacterium]